MLFLVGGDFSRTFAVKEVSFDLFAGGVIPLPAVLVVFFFFGEVFRFFLRARLLIFCKLLAGGYFFAVNCLAL